jgi:hypothetical protein
MAIRVAFATPIKHAKEIVEVRQYEGPLLRFVRNTSTEGKTVHIALSKWRGDFAMA